MNLPSGVSSRIVLVRHGAPVAAATGKCYGKLDVALSDDGRKQIARTAVNLKELKLTTVYSSPRVRAAESARIIAELQDLQIEISNQFAEIDFGDFENLDYATVQKRFPDVYEQWMKTPTTVEFPNGESFTQMQKRVLQKINELRISHQGKAFAVVSHGGVNRIILANYLGIANENIFRLAQDYACVNVIDFYGEFPVVRIINQTNENVWR